MKGPMIETLFSAPVVGIAGLSGDNILEPLAEAGRWNMLFNTDSRVYSQSAIFYPLDPGYYQKRLRMAAVNTVKMTDKELSSQLKKDLISVEIRNTDMCNSNCYFCFSRKDRKVKYNIDNAAYSRLIKSLVGMRNDTLFTARFCGGGEPLCHPMTVGSVFELESAGIPVNLITNGAGLNTDDLALLGSVATMVRFSVDAATPSTYEKMHGVDPVKFNTVLENIRSLVRIRNRKGRKGKMFIGATFLISEFNFHEIEKFTSVMKGAGVDLVWIKAVNNLPEFAGEDAMEITRQLKKSESMTDRAFFVSATRFRIARTFSDVYMNYNEMCYSVFTKAFISPDGNVVLCLSRNKETLGNINNESFDKIWGGERHVELIRNKIWSSCSDCLEARYNASADFMVKNSGVMKGWHSEDVIG